MVLCTNSRVASEVVLQCLRASQTSDADDRLVCLHPWPITDREGKRAPQGWNNCYLQAGTVIFQADTGIMLDFEADDQQPPSLTWSRKLQYGLVQEITGNMTTAERNMVARCMVVEKSRRAVLEETPCSMCGKIDAGSETAQQCCMCHLCWGEMIALAATLGHNTAVGEEPCQKCNRMVTVLCPPEHGTTWCGMCWLNWAEMTEDVECQHILGTTKHTAINAITGWGVYEEGLEHLARIWQRSIQRQDRGGSVEHQIVCYNCEEAGPPDPKMQTGLCPDCQQETNARISAERSDVNMEEDFRNHSPGSPTS